MTLVEELLCGLVGVHVALAEGGVDVGVGVAADDLLDRLDGGLDRRLPAPAAAPSRCQPCPRQPSPPPPPPRDRPNATPEERVVVVVVVVIAAEIASNDARRPRRARAWVLVGRGRSG